MGDTSPGSGRRNYALGVCKGKSVKIDTLDQIVLRDLADYISRPEIKAKFKNGKTQSLEASEQAKINTYQQDIAAIDISIQKLVDACTTSGDVAVKYLNERIEQMDAEKQKLQAEILQIKNKSSRKLELDGMNIDNAPASLESGSFEEKKYLCNFFIEKIILPQKTMYRLNILYELLFALSKKPVFAGFFKCLFLRQG